ncbi:glycosyltransferase family 4 protein [Halomonas sp. PAMB 3232]|uniref:glycosyltransferase family 4 protein n=1 Tax=Halomonas sp. PAMB 3232 TaxID=3075221 RepID=UPI00289EC646|nr:glycosyltransferase family 4 protein [Halomonas sp. PAMB 3232]WNL40120.1 glycosyltransferase family 4 protein [Halomonas sp. PAMB 3232]
MKVAIVHDWLTTWAGAEKALAELASCFPQAEIFTTVNFLASDDMPALKGRAIHTSVIQRLPFARKHYRRYLPLMPLAIEQFDLKGFDLILSSSHAVAKGVLCDPGAVHICYCYSPMRYAWDMQHQYLRQTGKERGVASWLMRWQLHRLRQWDFISAQRVDHFVAISHYIKRRIARCYRRDAEVIYPPVQVERFRHDQPRDEFYLTASRMVPYKRIDLIIEAFNRLPDKRLVVIGDGPDRARLSAMAGPNVTVLGYQPDDVLVDYLERARAFLFMAEEDFGILPVEAQAAGAPVIGYGVGGLSETMLDDTTGLWVAEQTSAALIERIHQFEQRRRSEPDAFSPTACRQSAERFATANFRRAILSLVEQHLNR